jgi:sugar lactone lactonase YvrE
MSTVTLTATPSSGWVFTGWTDSTCKPYGTNPCQLTLTSNVSVAGTFVQNFALNVAVTGTGGNVSSTDGNLACSSTGGVCSYTYNSGTSVTLNANASGGYAFMGWGGACASAGTATTCTVQINAATAVTALFTSYILTVAIGGDGTVTDGTPTGINCTEAGGVQSGNCSTSYVAGAVVSLGQTPAAGWKFANWGNDCSGTGACQLTMSANHTVTAIYDGPFNFGVTTPSLLGVFSLIQGESRDLLVAVTLFNGAPLPVNLTLSNLPPGVTGSFNPAAVTPNGTSVLTLTVASSVPVGSYGPITITGTSGTTTASTTFSITVRSPFVVNGPVGLALEDGGTTVLVSESGTNGASSNVVRMNVSDRTVLHTVSSEFTGAANDLAIESGGSTALLASGSGLVRIDLSTGFFTVISAQVSTPYGVAIESGGTSALVTDCGAAANCSAGRLVRVQLATGSVTPITTGSGLNGPAGVAIESGGTTALVVEGAGGRLLRVTLGDGALVALASGLAAPQDVLIEAGGSTALVTESQGLGMTRVVLATGTKTPISSFTSTGCGFANYGFGMAAETTAGQILVAERCPDRVVQHDLTYPVQAIAASRQSVSALLQPLGVALMTSGTSALLTDCGTGCSGGARLVQTDLTTGDVNVVIGALNNPLGVAVESGGATALITQSNNRLDRVNIAGGTLTNISSSTTLGNPEGVVIEPGGTTALVSTGTGGSVARVNLASGAVLANFGAPNGSCGFATYTLGLALESSGTTVLVVHQCPSQLLRLDTTTGVYTTVASGFNAPSFVAIAPGGSSAFVTEAAEGGRVDWVNLSAGQITVVAPAVGTPNGVALDATGLPLIAEQSGSRLLRLSASTVAASSDLLNAAFPSGVALEAGGTTALLLDCGGGTNCTNGGRLIRVTLATGAVSVITNQLNTPATVVPEAGGATALVTDCGPSGTNACGSNGRLLRVTLAGGTLAPIVPSGLNIPDGIAIQPGGTTALVIESGSSTLDSIDLTSGAIAPIATGLAQAHQVTLESGGTSALVADSSGGGGVGALQRVTLAGGAVTTVSQVNLTGFALEPSGASALVMLSSGSGNGPQCDLVRINVATGAVNVLANGVFDTSNTMVLDTAGANAYFTERRSVAGALYQLGVPP